MYHQWGLKQGPHSLLPYRSQDVAENNSTDAAKQGGTDEWGELAAEVTILGLIRDALE